MKTLILGIGNTLRQDDGFGVHLAEALKKENLPENVEILPLGTEDILSVAFEKFQKIVILDCIRLGGEKGTLYFIDDFTFSCDTPVSSHQMHPLSYLANQAKEQKVFLFGIEPYSTEWGQTLTPKAEKRIPDAIEFIKKEIRKCL